MSNIKVWEIFTAAGKTIFGKIVTLNQQNDNECPPKTQSSLGICPLWSKFFHCLSAEGFGP